MTHDQHPEIELLTVPELLALPPVKWLIEPLIPEEGFVGLYGAPGSGKSFVALDWALCIAEGRNWLGRFLTKQAPVIYIAAEGGRGMQQRVRAWMEHYGYKHDIPGLYFLLHPLYIREEGTIEAFLDMLEDADIWPGLVILDTLSRSFGGGEENASADMGSFVDSVTRLAAGRHMASLVIHHKNAQGSRERGNTAFRGAADAMFDCTAEYDAILGITRITVKNDKQKDGGEAETVYLAPVQDKKYASLVFEETVAPPKKDRGGKGLVPMRKVDMLTLLGTHVDGLTFTEWLLSSQVPRTTFRKRITRLMADGEIFKSDTGRYFVYPSNIDIALEDE